MADGHLRYWAGWDDKWLVSSVREKSFQEIGESVSGWWRIDEPKTEDGTPVKRRAFSFEVIDSGTCSTMLSVLMATGPLALEMICLQPAEVSDLAQLRQPLVGRAGGDPHADPGQRNAVPGGA